MCFPAAHLPRPSLPEPRFCERRVAHRSASSGSYRGGTPDETRSSDGLALRLPTARIWRPRRDPPLASEHSQSPLPFRVAARAKVRLGQFRCHRIEADLADPPCSQQRRARKHLRRIAVLSHDQIHEVPYFGSGGWRNYSVGLPIKFPMSHRLNHHPQQGFRG